MSQKVAIPEYRLPDGVHTLMSDDWELLYPDPGPAEPLISVSGDAVGRPTQNEPAQCPVRARPESEPRRLSLLETGRALVALTRADRVDHLVELVQRYPQGVVLVTPLNKMLITARPDAVKHVLVRHHDRYVKGLGQAQARQVVGDGLLTAEGQRWKDQREDVVPQLAARKVTPRSQDVARLARENVREIQVRGWDSIKPAVHLADYTLRCLSVTFGFQPPDAERIHDAFETVQDEAIFDSVTQGLLPRRLRPRGRRRVRTALADLGAEASRSLTGQLRSESWANTEGMTSLFLAGYETTASTLAWTLRYLAERPQLQGAVREEAAEFSRMDLSEITSGDHLAMDHAQSVFHEVLRIRPPVWLISRRVVSHDTVDGVEMNPKDEVLILPSASGAASSSGDHKDAANLAFGAGPRACPGGALANLEATFWIATACSHLDIRLRAGARSSPRARMSQNPADDLRRQLALTPTMLG